MDTVSKIFGGIILVVGFVVVVALILSVPLWLLWNWLTPIIFPTGVVAPHITLFQAFGILLLSGFLFKSSSSK